MLRLKCMSKILTGDYLARYGLCRVRPMNRTDRRFIGFATRDIERGEMVEFDPCSDTKDIVKSMEIERTCA